MVNKARVRRLVAALRSGKYKRGIGRLRSEDGKKFCCLGVACDISGVGEWKKDWLDFRYLGNSSSLPQEVQTYFGFDHSNPYLTANSMASDVNDGWGKSFKFIANMF